MRKVTWICVLSLGTLALAACGSSSGGGTTNGTGASSSSTTTSSTSGSPTSSSTTGGGGAGGTSTTSNGGAGGSAGTGGTASGTGGSTGNNVQLTVKNYLSWCSVSVNGMAASSLPSQVVAVPDNSTVNLSATALTGFDLGDWHHTAGDTGSGDPGTVTNGTTKTTVDVTTGTACVWICCPTHGLSDCPTTDQCP